MKRLCSLAVWVFMSAFMVTTVNAVPAGTPDMPKQQQGIKNAKKAMQSRLERDKRIDIVRKQGQAKRHQAQSGK